MPGRFEPGPTELKRRRDLAAISRISDPIDQCITHLAQRKYKDFSGELYTVLREDDRGQQEIKAGIAHSTDNRQTDYYEVCRGVRFMWLVKYKCDCVKLLERLVHLTLRELGATITPYPCTGCGVRHREFFDYQFAGGIDGVLEIIEFWLGVLGQRVEREVIKQLY